LALLVLSGTACQRTTPESGEQITAYFNDPLAGLVRMDRPQAGELKGKLLELLGSARREIDAAIYAVSDPEVIAALEGACARGVKLRVLTEAEEYHGQLAGLGCLQLRLDGNDRLMHDKFMIVDGGAGLDRLGQLV
jgi:phosphatidylserine/phosphatidylglycerophosphate/cardiolipin synthase-like enzyme